MTRSSRLLLLGAALLLAAGAWLWLMGTDPDTDAELAEAVPDEVVLEREPLETADLDIDPARPQAPLVDVTVPPGEPAGQLLVPVAGTEPDDLVDMFGDPRSGGRVHEAIDIMAPEGTPVLAAADGRIAKFFDSERGGITIYQFDPSEQHAYYYAHLDGRAPGLAEGDLVEQGEVIGFVGETGNARDPHLHFAVFRLTDEKKWWKGEAINPYPLLVAGR